MLSRQPMHFPSRLPMRTGIVDNFLTKASLLPIHEAAIYPSDALYWQPTTQKEMKQNQPSREPMIS